MANILMKQDPSPRDRDHAAGMVVAAVPPPYDPVEFERRFAVRLISQGFGMTEIYPIPHELAKQDWGRPHNFIGRAHETFDIRIADPDGRPIAADGTSQGEILIRPELPGYMMSGYYKDPAATVTTWRDLWFHTGDLATMDEEGFLCYQGRTSDSIRRRGENISAHELEQAVMSFHAVREAAAFGVPSDVGEEDVKVDVVWAESATPDAATPAALIEYLLPRLPFFMVPRFIQVRDELPKLHHRRSRNMFCEPRVLRRASLTAAARARTRKGEATFHPVSDFEDVTGMMGAGKQVHADSWPRLPLAELSA